MCDSNANQSCENLSGITEVMLIYESQDMNECMSQAPHLGRSEEPGRSSGDTKDHSEPH